MADPLPSFLSFRRKDLVLVKYLVLDRNADVFVRDRRGGRVLDNLAPGDHVTNLLKQASNNQKALAQRKGDGSPVAQRGYLLKYTNVAHGYKNRWFVIDDGVLSCQCPTTRPLLVKVASN